MEELDLRSGTRRRVPPTFHARGPIPRGNQTDSRATARAAAQDLGTGPLNGILVAPLQIRILHSTRNGLSPAERWSFQRPSLVLLQTPDDSRMTAFALPPIPGRNRPPQGFEL